jgi:4-amino-4-deoxy-L-arabinose transferase-like glycosyltransferase
MNKIDFSVKRINWAIVLISALMLLVLVNSPFKPNRFGDWTFHVESKNLALFLKGELPMEKVVITKAPGPILFYTPAYLLAPADATDDQLWVYGVFSSFVLLTISLLLIFRIGVTFFSKEVGLLSVLLFFIFPIHFYYALGILAEVPAFFSMALAIYGWSIAFNEPIKKRGWILLILGMWFLILNRPNAILLLGILILVIVYSFKKNKTFYAIYGKKLGFTFLIILILGVGTLQLAKKINGIKSGGSQEFLFYYVTLQGRFQFREEPTDFRFWESDNRPDSKDYQNWIKKGEQLDSIISETNRSYNDVYREFIINDVIDHPFLFIRQLLVRSFYGHITIVSKVQPQQFDLGPFQGALGFWTFLLIINSINLLVLLGVALFLFQEKNLIQYWIFWGVWLALLIFHGLTYMESRYIFPSKVALYVMSAAGLYRINWIKFIINKISFHLFPKTGLK